VSLPPWLLDPFDAPLTVSREIVDESDVYVDVHKAIRRLTPAPRARRVHGHSEVATAATAAALAAKNRSDILVDIAEHPDGQSVTVGSLGAQSDSGAQEQRPKTAIFMKRRSSAGPDGQANGGGGGGGGGTVPVKASLNDMRQQLRLGPANLASHPRNMTRNNVFKIKQGLSVTTLVPADTNGKPGQPHQHPPTSKPVDGEGAATPDEGEGETAPLLKGLNGNGNGSSNGEGYGSDASKGKRNADGQ